MLPRELRQTYAAIVTAAAAMIIKKEPGLVTWAREPGGAATRKDGALQDRGPRNWSVWVEIFGQPHRSLPA